MHCEPEVVEALPVWRIEEMGEYLRLDAMETHWRHEDNQDLYLAAVQKFRRDRGQKCEDPEDEEANVELEAKQLALKDAIKRKPGDRQQRASDMEPKEPSVAKNKGFGRRV